MDKKSKKVDIQNSTRRNLADMPGDVLTHIFAFLCTADVIFNVSKVCKSFRAASAESRLWKTLDLQAFKWRLRFYRPSFSASKQGLQCSRKFMLFLDNVLKGNLENLTKLIVSTGKIFNDEQLIYIAQRSPNLKYLALPTCPLITQKGLQCALRLWVKLETISISCSFDSPHLIIQEIGENCKNIIAIKIDNGSFNIDAALAMINCLPNLKILTLCCRVEKDEIEILLDNLKNLEELYISRPNMNLFSIFISDVPSLGNQIFQKASRLQQFHLCVCAYCTKCPAAPFNFKLIKK